MGGLSGDKTMQDSTMLAVARYIVESRRNRYNNRTTERGTNSNTQEPKPGRDQGDWHGDERHSSNDAGQGWNNV